MTNGNPLKQEVWSTDMDIAIQENYGNNILDTQCYKNHKERN
jgi:hypothetical protein